MRCFQIIHLLMAVYGLTTRYPDASAYSAAHRERLGTNQDDWATRHAGLQDARDQQIVVHTGYHPPRTPVAGVGPVEVSQPRPSRIGQNPPAHKPHYFSTVRARRNKFIHGSRGGVLNNVSARTFLHPRHPLPRDARK